MVPSMKRKDLRPTEKHVTKGSTISTDELVSYAVLPQKGYRHGKVRHSRDKWVSGIHHGNGVEGSWKHLKGGIRSTHIMCRRST